MLSYIVRDPAYIGAAAFIRKFKGSPFVSMIKVKIKFYCNIRKILFILNNADKF